MMNAGRGTDNRPCFQCGQIGHQKRECPQAPPLPGMLGTGGEDGGYTGAGGPWRCEICGWQNKSMNKVCGGGHSKYGCGNSQQASSGGGMVKAGEVRAHAEEGVVTEGVGVRFFKRLFTRLFGPLFA